MTYETFEEKDAYLKGRSDGARDAFKIWEEHLLEKEKKNMVWHSVHAVFSALSITGNVVLIAIILSGILAGTLGWV